MTPDLLKKVFKFFESKSNPAVVFVFEALVGIMRGTKYADNKSVEIYTQKYEGFKLALDRVDFKKINPNYCQEYRNQLNTTYD